MIENEVRVRVLKRGIQPPSVTVGYSLSSGPPRNVVILHAPLGLGTDMMTRHGPSRDLQDLVFDDD